MARILIVYYSHTGNTEKMAEAVAEGARGVEGTEVEMKRHESPWKVAGFDAVLIGAPTYQHNMTKNIKDFLAKIAFQEVDLTGKIGAAFGSYGWSGEAPQFVLEVMEHKFGMQVMKPPLLIKNTPDEKGVDECRKLGKAIAERLQRSP